MTRTLLAVVALLAVALPGLAQKSPRVRGDGVELFAALLHFQGLTPATPAEFAAAPPAGRVLILLDQQQRTREFDRLARDTLAGGGSVLWAADRGQNLGSVLQDGTRLATSSGTAVPPPGAPCLNDDPDYPLLIARPPSAADQAMIAAGLKLPDPAGLLLAGLPGVAAFRPGLVAEGPTGGRYTWTVLATLPRGTVVPREATRLPAVAVASHGTGAKTHRALVVANSRVFANRLLAAEGADNLAFANNVVAWLSDAGRRKPCLLVVNGTPVTQFDAVTFQETPPIPPIPIPDFFDAQTQAKLTNLVNETLGKLEANDAFNRLLTGDDPDKLRQFLQGVAIGVACLVFALALRRLLGAKHAPDHTPVPRDPVRAGAPDPAARQREELLQLGEYRGLVADYLRGWFAGCGAAAGPGLPEIRVRPGVPATPLLGNLRILWGVAFDPPPAPGRGAARHAVPYSRWKQLEPMIHAAQAGHAAGDWRLAEPKELA